VTSFTWRRRVKKITTAWVRGVRTADNADISSRAGSQWAVTRWGAHKEGNLELLHAFQKGKTCCRKLIVGIATGTRARGLAMPRRRGGATKRKRCCWPRRRPHVIGGSRCPVRRGTGRWRFSRDGPSPYRFQLLGGECFLPYSRCQTIPGTLVFRRSSMDDEEHDVRSGFVFQDHLTLYSALGFFNFSQTLYGPSWGSY